MVSIVYTLKNNMKLYIKTGAIKPNYLETYEILPIPLLWDHSHSLPLKTRRPKRMVFNKVINERGNNKIKKKSNVLKCANTIIGKKY